MPEPAAPSAAVKPLPTSPAPSLEHDNLPEAPKIGVPAGAPVISAGLAPPPATPKTRTTPSLKSIFNGPAEPETVVAPAEVATNEPIKPAELRKAWEHYAEKRKDQAAEYQILLREYHYKAPVITINLTNPVEESLLDNFRRDLIQYLRDRFKNNEITIVTAMQSAGGKKVIYTSKEKFEHLAEKYPYLRELKDKLGLDWEF